MLAVLLTKSPLPLRNPNTRRATVFDVAHDSEQRGDCGQRKTLRMRKLPAQQHRQQRGAYNRSRSLLLIAPHFRRQKRQPCAHPPVHEEARPDSSSGARRSPYGGETLWHARTIADAKRMSSRAPTLRSDADAGGLP